VTESASLREIAAVERRLQEAIRDLGARIDEGDRRMDDFDRRLVDFFREFSDRITQLGEAQRKAVAEEIDALRKFVLSEDEELWNELPSYVSQKEYEAVKVMVYGYAGTLLLGVCYAILKTALKE